MSGNGDRLSQREAAREMGVRITTLLERTRSGEYPAAVKDYVKEDGTPGKHYVWYRSELQEYKRERGRIAARRSMDGAA